MSNGVDPAGGYETYWKSHEEIKVVDDRAQEDLGGLISLSFIYQQFIRG